MTNKTPSVSPRLFRALTVASLFAGLATPVAASDWFDDVTAESGLDFRYDNGMTGEFWFPEIMGAGVGLLDFNGNGLLDIYLVQGGALGPDIGPDDRLQGDRLFRNDSFENAAGEWVWRFTDVTEAAGIDARGYGMGVAIGDINGNGHPDIYVLNFGDNQLWRNNGDGTFTDITAESGANDPRWSVSASFVDLDGSGQLDLFVANYVSFSFAGHRACRSATTGLQDYCSPSAYQGIADGLFRNLGNGRFENVSQAAGIGGTARHGLGVVAADFNGNGRPDIYVANDGSANSLWLNQGDFTFVDDAFLAGVAVNVDGAMEAGMGVDAADYNRSGRDSLFITHMRRETNTLYRNDGDGWFSDITAASGLGSPSFSFTGFGTAWLDLDNDGWLDLVVANGAVVVEESLVNAGDPFPYHQINQLFLNQGNGRFEDATRRGGAAFQASHVTRGLAVGDLNNNGRLDVVMANINGPARVLANTVDNGHHWLGLRLLDASGVREKTGAVAWLLEGDAPVVRRRSRTDGSYASANDGRILFGLADQSEARRIEVHWPTGQRERFGPLAVDRYHTITQGSGEAVANGD
ncbi:MAG: CRTAC1 family protein [Wenzhouxiangella sp.]